MKKLLSLVLTAALLLTMLVVPVAATGEQAEEKFYYNFDFSESALYTDYENPVLPEGVTYESFDAVGTSGEYVIDYGKIGDKDGLYIRTANDNKNIVFTPLKEDGTPVVLEAGKNYVVEWDFTITRFSGAWARAHIEPFTTLNGASSNAGNRYTAFKTTTTGEGEEATTTTDYLKWNSSAKAYLGFGSLIAGDQIVYWDKSSDGVKEADKTVLDAYTKKTETVEGAEGEEATQVVSFELLEDNAATTSKEDAVFDNSLSATGTAYSFTKTIAIASDDVLADYNVTKNEDGSYIFNEVNYNNFLGFSLPGGYGTYYYPGYDEKSVENVQDADGNWYHRGYSEYYVTGLRIYEEGYDFTEVALVNGDNETVLTYAPGETIEYPALARSMNGDTYWSLSANELVAVPTVAGTEDITAYAYNSGVVGFERYLTSQYFHHTNYANATFSNDFANSGTTSMKFRNYNVVLLTAEPTDWATNWTAYYAYDEATDTFVKLSGEVAPEYAENSYYKSRTSSQREQGTFTIYDFKAVGKQSYSKKVTLKYYIPENNKSAIKLQVYQYATGSIWWNTPVAVGDAVTIPANATSGWQTAEIYIAAADVFAYQESKNQGLYIKATAVTDSAYAICYFDDVTVEDFVVDNKVVYHYNDGTTEDTVITEGIRAGATYAIDRVPTAPEGKYFAGWYTDEGCTVAATSPVTVPASGTVELYAKYEDYTSTGTYDYKNADIENVNGLGYIYDNTYYSTLNETVWGDKTYTADGVLMGKSEYGAAYVFDPDKTDGVVQYTAAAADKYLGVVEAADSTKYADMEVGAETVVGWGQNGNIIAKDASGKPFIAKPNTEYSITVKYNMTQAGAKNTTMGVGIGRPLAMGQIGSNANGIGVYNSIYASSVVVNAVGSGVQAFTITTDDLLDTVPVVSIHLGYLGFMGAKADVEPYTLDDGRKVYAFEKVDRAQIYIEEIIVSEVNSTVTIINGEKETVVKGTAGTAIVYPTLTASKNGTPMYSASADSYVAAPTEFAEGNQTVYVVYDTLIDFENYIYTSWTEASNYVNLSDEKPYDGTYGIKYTNFKDIGYSLLASKPSDWDTGWTKYYSYDGENGYVKLSGETAPEFAENTYYKYRVAAERENAIELWGLEAGTSYKVTFKYYVEEGNETSIDMLPYTGDGTNLWDPVNYLTYNEVRKTLAPAEADGQWHDGVLYITTGGNAKNYLYIRLSPADSSKIAVAYFDNFNYEVVETATFNILADGVTVEGEGNYDSENGVFTAYGNGATLKAPTVITESGAKIENWYTDEACTVEATSIVAGGVYYGTIEYVEFVASDGSSTKVYYNDGDVIEYPEIAASRNYDSYWSLKADAYEAVPENFDGTVTVYAVKSDVISFENYAEIQFASGSVNLAVSDEIANTGNKSMKYTDVDCQPVTAEPADWATKFTNYYSYDEEAGFVKLSGDTAPAFEEGKYYSSRNNQREHSIGLGKLGAEGTTYKVTFKYYVPEALTGRVRVTPYTNMSNLWAQYNAETGTGYITYDAFTIAASTETGKWLDGEVYFTSLGKDLETGSDYNLLYMLISNDGTNTGEVVYFDDFATTEVNKVSFVIPEGMTAEIYTGTLKDGVITSYFAKDAEITAPVVIDADGNPVTVWKDADGKTVTEFVADGVYTASVAPEFIYGDCNDDGDINTTDLAALKLYLAGSGEVGSGGDCNGDGDINTTDLAALKLFLAGSGVLGPQE